MSLKYVDSAVNNDYSSTNYDYIIPSDYNHRKEIVTIMSECLQNSKSL